MKPSFIIDCSLTMAWCFADEATPGTREIQDRMIDESAIVPSHWFLEVSNVLAMCEKRKRISPADSDQFLDLIRTFAIHHEDESARRSFRYLLPLCRKHGLTSYDAAYLDLAMRARLPLASLDDDLRRAAANEGLPVLGK